MHDGVDELYTKDAQRNLILSIEGGDYLIYLDNASTTRASRAVLDAMQPYLDSEYGNPGAIYSLGRNAKDAVDKARKQVADYIGASPEQIIFTASGSEANTIVIRNTQDYLNKHGHNAVLVSASEHDSIMKAVENMSVLYVRVNEYGEVSADDVNVLLESLGDIGLVSVMYANNETGTVNKVKLIADICSKHGVLFHTDCVQAAGCYPIDVNEIGCDFLTLSAHKIHGVKGVGALFVRDKKTLSTQIYGGLSQEYGIRSGTENVAGIVAFGEACRQAAQMQDKVSKIVSLHRKIFYNTLVQSLTEHGFEHIVHINGSMIDSGGKILNIRLDGIDAETLVLLLDARGVCISAGSACRSRESEPSYVLTAMGLTPEQARHSVRVSFSWMNTHSEVREAAKIMAKCIVALKR